jgi:hypothetical protein
MMDLLSQCNEEANGTEYTTKGDRYNKTELD